MSSFEISLIQIVNPVSELKDSLNIKNLIFKHSTSIPFDVKLLNITRKLKFANYERKRNLTISSILKLISDL